MRKLIAASALAAVLGPLAASANEFERVPVVTDSLVKKECGACHMAFQPAFLPARSWQAMMDDLANHFGENASLPDQPRQAITAYLTANAADAGRYKARFDGTPLRISDLAWWVREHGKEVSPQAWKKAGSKANCVACHPRAEAGLYEDD